MGRTWVIRGQLISTDWDLVGGQPLILVVRDKDGNRIEPGQYGPLTLHVGDARFSSEGVRSDINERFGYTADTDLLDEPGGQDAGVWLWRVPEDASGLVKIEADWLPQLSGGDVELIE
jgi:hypothetical protein